jgi:DNA polymerase/3'-5' exonuclease PolX
MKVRRLRHEVAPLVEEIQDWALDEVGTRWEIGGSWRRGAPEVGDVDVVVFFPTLDVVELPAAFVPERHGSKIAQGEMRGVHVDFWACPPEAAGAFLWFITGPKELNVFMRSRALSLGMKLTQTELQPLGQLATEREVSDALQLTYLDPSERQDWRQPSQPLGVAILGDSGNVYRLRRDRGRVTCTCKAFEFRGRCKHASDPDAWIKKAKE